MYWDLVKVRPEPDYSLSVGFKDGVTGPVRLQWEELTGVLTPLRDRKFFEQVVVDSGAVAWPGEIDLAPDAMYAQITCHMAAPQAALRGPRLNFPQFIRSER